MAAGDDATCASRFFCNYLLIPGADTGNQEGIPCPAGHGSGLCPENPRPFEKGRRKLQLWVRWLTDTFLNHTTIAEQAAQAFGLAVANRVAVVGQVLNNLVDLLYQRLTVEQKQLGPHILIEFCHAG